MADLPEDRTEPALPFAYCGVDFFGTFYVKEGRKEIKRYGALFTCMSSRAIHIETASSLSTDSFINCLRRFLSLRGPIRQLRCDRGSNFVGAENELIKALSEMNKELVKQLLLEEQCDFKFNVPYASHMGGVWERQIRTVRSVLSSLLCRAKGYLDDDSLRTFLYETAAIINCRPLSVNDLNNSTVLEPLTPNHLLTMKSKVILPPPGEFQSVDLYSRERWRRVQFLLNDFWDRWRKEYLQNLQPRSKWNKEHPNVEVGNIVLLSDLSLPRGQWRLARVTRANLDNDGHVCTVKIALGDPTLNDNGNRSGPLSLLERPIHKLILFMSNTNA